MVVGFGFSGWDTAQAVHETLLVVPGDVVGGGEFNVALTVADQSASLDVGFFGDGDDDEKVTTFDLLDRRVAMCRDRDGQVLQHLSTAASRGSGPQRYTRVFGSGA